MSGLEKPSKVEGDDLMKHRFDLVVIGTGTAAQTAAHACRAEGMSVAVVGERPFGGTCAMRGCQAKKYFVEAARMVDQARAMQGLGIAGAPQIHWKELQAQKRAFTDKVPESTEKGLAGAGMTLFHGRARFVGENSVQVGPDVLTGDFVLVATGAKPIPLGFPGSELCVTSDDFLELDELPARIGFVGGGFISMEFAHVAALAGAEVTIVQRSDRILRSFDPDLVGILMQASRELGVEIHLDAPIASMSRSGPEIVVRHGEQGDAEHCFDMVVHGAGRAPRVRELGLEAAGVAFDEHGIEVDGSMRSVSNGHVFAVGDVAATPYQLALVADREAETAARNILGRETAMDHAAVTSVVFTCPPLARVGLSEEQARDSGLDFRVSSGDPLQWPSSWRVGQHHAGYKVLLENGSERILGAHLLGHGMDEAVNVLSLAVRKQMTGPDVLDMLWGYPTFTSDLKYMLR